MSQDYFVTQNISFPVETTENHHLKLSSNCFDKQQKGQMFLSAADNEFYQRQWFRTVIVNNSYQ